MEGAIARYAEQVYLEELSEADREVVPRLLVQLVEPTRATAHVRRVARRTELDPARWQLAQRLATARLLVAGRDSAEVETVELVHEALIEHWDRLREWAEADRGFRAWQERLRDTMAAWCDSGHDTGALLRGGPLGEAEGWLQQRAEDLVPTERDFITASRAFQGRSLRRLRALSAGLAVLLVAALIFGVLTVFANRRAEHQSRLATSAYLVAKAEALEETRPDLALLLSVAAFRLQGTREATERLVRMASDRRDVHALLATDGAAAVAVAFNPADGRMLVSAGADAIVFWDAERRAQVGKVAARGVSEFAWSPDGRVLASGGSLDQVRLWDPRRRAELGRPLTGAPDGLLGLTFSPDGRLLAACGGGEIVLWDLQKRSVLDAIKADSPNDCRAGFTSDGRQLVYAAGGSIITRGIGRRRVRRADIVPYVPDGPVQDGEDQAEPSVTSFAPSPDGTKALVRTDQVDLPMLWDLRRATRLATLPMTSTS